MASLRLRHNTWYAVWRFNGKQIVKSTNIQANGPKEKKLAQNTADTMEQAAKGNITMHQALEAIRGISSTIGFKKKLPSVLEFLTEHTPKGAEVHRSNVKRAIELFLQFLGSDAHQPIDILSVQSCRNFIEEQLKRVSKGTVSNYKANLSSIFQLAVEDEIIPRNPFSLVNLSRCKQNNSISTVKRLPFTIQEIHQLVTGLHSPWREIVLMCILTGGQRLGDIVCMKWEQVDWANGRIVIRTMKTGKVIATPITNAVKSLLEPLSKPYQEYIFPDMAKRYIRSSGSLSSEFTSILKGMGIIKPENLHKGAGGRKISDKSFHSLRHSVVSILRVNASFTADLIRETVGHDSEEVERGYFTPDVESKRSVINFLAQQITPTA